LILVSYHFGEVTDVIESVWELQTCCHTGDDGDHLRHNHNDGRVLAEEDLAATKQVCHTKSTPGDKKLGLKDGRKQRDGKDNPTMKIPRERDKS
jgi:hypothetical protein